MFAKWSPWIEPALVLVAVGPQGDAVSVEPRKFVLQTFSG